MMFAVAMRQLVAALTSSRSICATSTLSGSAAPIGSSINVFDRKAKRNQRIRAATASDADTYDYLKDRVNVCCYILHV